MEMETEQAVKSMRSPTVNPTAVAIVPGLSM
jgi:hypothetical protein